MNPFILKGYAGPENFCDREEETNTLKTALINKQDITLYGYRRLGKSALIHHVFQQMSMTHICIYADLWGATTIRDFVRELANSIIRADITQYRSVSTKIMDFIRSIGASLSIGMDGSPSVELIYNDKKQTFRSLEEIMSYLEGLPRPVILAIDEFQEIRKFGEPPFEAKLRSLVQLNKNVSYVFSGSEHHLLNQIFNEYNQPFYQSTRMINLPKIQEEKYASFIISQFQKNKRSINPDLVNHLLDITYRHTYYIQALCNYLFSLDTLPESVSEFEKVYYPYLLEKKVFYAELPEQLTIAQFRCLKAFAKEGLVSSPTSSRFLLESEVINASSMQRIIQALADKQLIIKDEEGYRIYDVFLAHFLKYLA